MSPEQARSGRVVALQANYCLVALDAPGPQGCERLLCTRRTRLDKSGLQVWVGDRVRVDGIDWTAGRGAIAAVEPRTSLLGRPAVANVSRVLVVVALGEPALDPLQLTRFLITAEATGRPVGLVFSKADLQPEAVVREWCERASGWGYPVLALSTRSGAGLEGLRQWLREPGIHVLCGPSGVGKSSLLNALVPHLDLRVSAVSGRLRRGRHTTRHVELFPLGDGALLADSPGFNRPALPDDAARLVAAFPELRLRLATTPCRFSNCRHLDDPGCAVGSDWDRFPLYAQCLAELEADRSPARARERSSGVRVRGGREEPVLDPRLRRESRRRGRQGLAEELSPPDPEG